MANEITAQAGMQVSKGGVSESLSGSSNVTMAGANVLKATQTIATAATQLALTGITGIPPCLVVHNLDAANYVEIDSANTFDKFPQKVLAGGYAILWPETATIWLKAHTASVQVQYLASEP